MKYGVPGTGGIPWHARADMDSLDFLNFVADFSSTRIITAYDELPLWSAMFGLLLLDEVPIAGVKVALDVGCGTGFPLIELAERLGPATHVHGLDPWAAALSRAAEKIASRETLTSKRSLFNRAATIAKVRVSVTRGSTVVIPCAVKSDRSR
jgi:SAM-dependent methyltransferase